MLETIMDNINTYMPPASPKNDHQNNSNQDVVVVSHIPGAFICEFIDDFLKKSKKKWVIFSENL